LSLWQEGYSCCEISEILEHWRARKGLSETESRSLERLVRKLALENEFLKKGSGTALASLRETGNHLPV
jgi:hypothetical protein